MTEQSAIRSPLAQVPAKVHCAADYARLASDFMAPALYAHIQGGSGHDRTARANVSAFAGLAIVPRVLRKTA